jgi:PAS domain S-box-containing protein
MKKSGLSELMGKLLRKGTTGLSASENHYSVLIENLPQKVFCKDNEGRFLSMNNAFAKDLKIKAHECVGTTVYDFFPRELADKYTEDDQRILSSGKVENIEELYVVDGEQHTVHTTKAPLLDLQGKAKGLIGIFRDITEQKRAEQIQEQQEQDLIVKNRISQIFLNTPDAKMYSEVLEVFLEVMDSEFGVFGYVDEDGALIVPSMSRGVWWEKCNVPDKDIKFPCDKWGNGSWPRALREMKSNYTNETSSIVPKGHIPITRHISIPIVYRGQSIGIMQVANREKDYEEKDVTFMEELVSQFAPSLKARLERDLEEKRRKELENKVIETVNILVSSSSEILAATTQIASGAAESASAISETSATVEEVRQAAELSSQKASLVSENARQVAQVTKAGQKAVDETITGMQNIQNQMVSIANTIVRLTEQSQQIGGIIASVNDVADQSNLLAVNAAIEAAKAGEQGKGFAVVAQEIKSLALQSKQATIQVRNILSEVQKTTSAAVMATEQGSKAVENGVVQSTRAGESIRLLSETVNESIQAANQIAASSQEQVVGMDQVGLAMTNINQAGEESAASMMQAETAAKGLHEIGQNLKHLVEQNRK